MTKQIRTRSKSKVKAPQVESPHEKAKRLVSREVMCCASYLVNDLYKLYWDAVRMGNPLKIPDISFGEDEVMELYSDKNGEVFEHWIVTERLGEKLKEHGEVVVSISNLTIWCRTTTGQMLAADEVIETIAVELFT